MGRRPRLRSLVVRYVAWLLRVDIMDPADCEDHLRAVRGENVTLRRRRARLRIVRPEHDDADPDKK